MKIYTKIILDKNNKLIEQEYYNYFGPISNCGIHYTYGANKGSKLMEKKAKRERKLAEKRAKKQAKSSFVKEEKKEDKTIPLDQVITLDHLTNPDKK
jgi:hypothetical protein|tara:strand:- start:667 stop:957 length:291 start_codon:yes stop_codon:yes gene_type:complete